MARKLFNLLVLVPIAIVLIAFAIANRHIVTVSFDPFDNTDASLGVHLPLFAVIILSLITGVLAGGAATWLQQSRWRRAARRHQAEAAAAKAQLSAARPPESGPLATLMRPNR